MMKIIVKILVMMFGLFLVNYGYVILHPTVWWDGILERSSTEETFVFLMFVNVVVIEIMRRWVKQDKSSLNAFAIMGAISSILIIDRIHVRCFYC